MQASAYLRIGVSPNMRVRGTALAAGPALTSQTAVIAAVQSATKRQEL